MNVFEFMCASPGLSFFLGLIVGWVLITVLFRLPNRVLRSINIKNHGWPPSHLDADGDFKVSIRAVDSANASARLGS